MERDAGKSKKQVKDVIIRRFGRSLPSSVDSLVDAVYETRELSPADAGTISLYLCYKEFGLIELNPKFNFGKSFCYRICSKLSLLTPAGL